MKRAWPVIREALVSAWSQPVASAVSIVIVAGMVASVLLTTGRTVGSEEAVLRSIDSAGTRSIIVRGESGSGLNSSVIERLRNIDGVYWIGALSAATDVTNAAVPEGVKVPARRLWTDHPEVLGLPMYRALVDEMAWASPRALDELGMTEAVGGVVAPAGESFSISGSLATPEYLMFLEPLVVIPQETGAEPAPIAVLVVIAERPELVAPLSEIVMSVLAVEDPTQVSLTTSERLAELRALIEGQLGTFGRALVLLIFGVSALLVTAVLYGLVLLRRKDFGRRRALGASQGLIMSLLLIQMLTLAIVGAVVGALVSVIVLIVSGDPLPGLDFILSIAILAVAVAVAAALIPAFAAARREPITELRVP